MDKRGQHQSNIISLKLTVTIVTELQDEAGLVQMSDLLYQKQSQLEKMAAERSAQHMAYEQQLALARDETDSRRYLSFLRCHPKAALAVALQVVMVVVRQYLVTATQARAIAGF